MRIANSSLITSSVDLSSSWESEGIWLGHISQYSIQLVFTGAPQGNFKLQCSNDLGKSSQTNSGWSDEGVVNWTDVADSAQAITAAGDHAWDVADVGYRWVRVVWTFTGGTGNLTSAVFNGKGV
ncbi:MAG: hypothetical protein FMNOHCHN_03746 [Ignavibacteriaceae bacterium]|nr:hypothetical protein [Ignavibacteriaceae bacterium]